MIPFTWHWVPATKSDPNAQKQFHPVTVRSRGHHRRHPGKPAAESIALSAISAISAKPNYPSSMWHRLWFEVRLKSQSYRISRCETSSLKFAKSKRFFGTLIFAFSIFCLLKAFLDPLSKIDICIQSVAALPYLPICVRLDYRSAFRMKSNLLQSF